MGLTIGDFEIAARFAEWIEILAVIAIAVAVVASIVAAAIQLIPRGVKSSLGTMKRVLGQGLLVGLDLLIAADVIRTVTIEPTIENVAGLGLLVLVRTVLNWTLTVEIEQRWPWQPPPVRPTE